MSLGKAAVDGPKTRAPGTHVGDLDGAPGSWLQPGPDLGFCGHLGSEPVEGRSLSLSPYNSAFQAHFKKKLYLFPSSTLPK